MSLANERRSIYVIELMAVLARHGLLAPMIAAIAANLPPETTGQAKPKTP